MRVESKFAKVVQQASLKRIELDCCNPSISGVHGILTTTKIQYQDYNLLGRDLEYFFWLPEYGPLEVSVQFYQNVSKHWRLFAFNKKGMLFSVNLTTATKESDGFVLQQTLTIRTQSLTYEQRQENKKALIRCLEGMGYEIREGKRVYLGTFDGKTGGFLDTTARAFLRDFVVLSVLKGHFMSNKGYELPNLKVKRLTQQVPLLGHDGQSRSIPADLRFRILERDRRCLACGKTPEDGIRLHIDHIKPFSLGGRTVESNLQTLCERCNLGKGNRSASDFRTR